jgi:hypothetical protein
LRERLTPCQDKQSLELEQPSRGYISYFHLTCFETRRKTATGFKRQQVKRPFRKHVSYSDANDAETESVKRICMYVSMYVGMCVCMYDSLELMSLIECNNGITQKTVFEK